MSKNIYHSHHIIPKYLGGTDHPDNLARLTVSEHAEAHRKLYEEHGHWQDKLAWQGLAGIIGHEECVARAYKSQLGKPLTEEHKWNISNGKTKKKFCSYKPCFRCSKFTRNPKFCSRSCSASNSNLGRNRHSKPSRLSTN
tara:strand:+ start:231 stop:650 length:420 start_codon:yes stop_codon:yes gene_type:complete